MTLWDNNLIALDAGGFVDRLRVAPWSAKVSFARVIKNADARWIF
jgi:hypothetical protein